MRTRIIKIKDYQIIPGEEYEELFDYLYGTLGINADINDVIEYINKNQELVFGKTLILKPKSLKINNSRTYLYKIKDGVNINTNYQGPKNLKEHFILFNKLSIEDWQTNFNAFIKNKNNLPTFFFKATENGIITTTFPVSGLVYLCLDFGYLKNIKDAKDANVLFKDVEFLFTPIKNSKHIKIPFGQLLPIFKTGDTILNFSPSPFLDANEIFWSNTLFHEDIIMLSKTFMLTPLNSEISKDIFEEYYSKEYFVWKKSQIVINAENSIHNKLEEYLYNYGVTWDEIVDHYY